MTGSGLSHRHCELSLALSVDAQRLADAGQGAMFMRVFITGGSGLIGRHLARGLLEAGHQPVILSRHSDASGASPSSAHYQVVQGDPATEGRWQDEVDGCDAVVNLAGHNLFAERWNPEIKRKIRDSRVYGTEHVVAAISRPATDPVSWCRPRRSATTARTATRSSTSRARPDPTSWRSSVASGSRPPSRSRELGVRRAVVRIGIVLAPGEGALAFMTPIFKLGPGAPIGSGGSFGRQGAAVDELDPHRRHRRHLPAGRRERRGGRSDQRHGSATRSATPSSPRRSRACSESPTRPGDFFIPVGPPDAVLQLMLGEVAGVVTAGQKVLPSKARALGYHFKFPDLEEALRDVFTPKPVPPPSQKPVAAGAGAHH